VGGGQSLALSPIWERIKEVEKYSIDLSYGGPDKVLVISGAGSLPAREAQRIC